MGKIINLMVFQFFISVLFTNYCLTQDILIKDCDEHTSSATAQENMQCDEWQVEYEGTDGNGFFTEKSLERCLREIELRKDWNEYYSSVFKNDQKEETFSVPICVQCKTKGSSKEKTPSDRLSYAKMIYKKAMNVTLSKMKELRSLIEQNPFRDVGKLVKEYKNNLLDAANKLEELKSKLDPTASYLQENVYDEISKLQSELQTELLNVDKSFSQLSDEIKDAINNKKFDLEKNELEKEKLLAEIKQLDEEKRIAEEKKLEEERQLAEEKKLAEEKSEKKTTSKDEVAFEYPDISGRWHYDENFEGRITNIEWFIQQNGKNLKISVKYRYHGILYSDSKNYEITGEFTRKDEFITKTGFGGLYQIINDGTGIRDVFHVDEWETIFVR